MTKEEILEAYNENSVFPNILILFEYLRAKGWIGFAHSAPVFECMELYDNRMVAAPMPMSPLYRGENEWHEICKPSLYRRTWSTAELFEREIQLSDFRKMLEVHPEIIDMKRGGLFVNYTGLAQHYGIATNVLDLTNSPLVAAFFATTEYDSLRDCYRPILHTVSQRVIYFFEMGCFWNIGSEPKIWPIGQEALRRPGEQRGYGIEMNVNDNLNDYPIKHVYRFWHTPHASMTIWNMSKGGAEFFPYDPMAEKVRNMKKYRIYSIESLQEVYERNYSIAPTLDEARRLMENSGCTFVEKLPFAYTENEIEYINEEFKRMYPGNFE